MYVVVLLDNPFADYLNWINYLNDKYVCVSGTGYGFAEIGSEIGRYDGGRVFNHTVKLFIWDAHTGSRRDGWMIKRLLEWWWRW